MKTIFALFLLSLTGVSMASPMRIYCETPYRGQSILIEKEKVSFFDTEEYKKENRKLASVNKLQEHHSQFGLKRTINFEGKTFRIGIDHVGNFDENKDYLRISNSKGHAITYPINCENLD